MNKTNQTLAILTVMLLNFNSGLNANTSILKIYDCTQNEFIARTCQETQKKVSKLFILLYLNDDNSPSGRYEKVVQYEGESREDFRKRVARLYSGVKYRIGEYNFLDIKFPYGLIYYQKNDTKKLNMGIYTTEEARDKAKKEKINFGATVIETLSIYEF